MENFSEISQILKSARQRSGLSLPEIQEITKIQLGYLQAIEAGDQQALPNLFYAKMWVRRFAEAVNTNVDDLIDDNQTELKNFNRNRQLSKKAILNHPPKIRDRFLNNLTLIIATSIILIGLIGSWLFFSNRLNNQTTRANSLDDKIQISSKKPSNNLSKSSSTKSKQLSAKLNGPDFEQDTASFVCKDDDDNTIVVQVGSASWVEVLIDDVQMYTGTMAGGSQLEFDFNSSNSNITIHTGNSRETGISFDGELLNFKDGSPIEINNITIDR